MRGEARRLWLICVSLRLDVVQSNQAKDMKLVTLQNEVNNLRNFLRVKDR